METACVVAPTSYTVVLKVGIRDDGGTVLMRAKEFVTTVTPTVQKFTSKDALNTRCENLALANFATEFDEQLERDYTIQRMLRGRDWSFFSKAVSITEAQKEAVPC